MLSLAAVSFYLVNLVVNFAKEISYRVCVVLNITIEGEKIRKNTEEKERKT